MLPKYFRSDCFRVGKPKFDIHTSLSEWAIALYIQCLYMDSPPNKIDVTPPKSKKSFAVTVIADLCAKVLGAQWHKSKKTSVPRHVVRHMQQSDSGVHKWYLLIWKAWMSWLALSIWNFSGPDRTWQILGMYIQLDVLTTLLLDQKDPPWLQWQRPSCWFYQPDCGCSQLFDNTPGRCDHDGRFQPALTGDS